MKRIRVLALLGAMLALVAPALQAQGGGGQGRGRQMEMLMQGITLTDAQKAKVDSIGTAYRAQMPAFNRDAPPDSAARAKRMELMQKQYSDIRAVLDAEQQKVFDKNLEEMRSRMGQRPRP